jgi:Organic solute transporter Ostalpha
MVYAGIIKSDTEYSANNMSLALQDVILCLEMPLFSWMHYYAFPWTDYDDSRLSSRLSFLYAVRDALGLKDIVHDTYATFVAAPPRKTPTRPPLRDLWDDNEEFDEETPIRNYGFASYNDTAPVLQFDDPDSEDEKDYDACKRLAYGDFKFPVISEDARFSAPPNVLNEVTGHISDYTSRLKGQRLPNRKGLVV